MKLLITGLQLRGNTPTLETNALEWP